MALEVGTGNFASTYDKHNCKRAYTREWLILEHSHLYGTGTDELCGVSAVKYEEW